MANRRLTFRCPHCSYSFARFVRDLKGKTSCPKCGERFDRASGHQVGEFADDARAEIQERKMARHQKIFAKRGLTPNSLNYDQIIRGAQVPAVHAEAVFKANCLSRGWLAHRPSWPDYIVEKPDGLIGVEVKSENDVVSNEQQMTFDMLEAMGVPIFVWKKTGPDDGELIKWTDFKKIDIEATRIKKRVAKQSFLRIVNAKPKHPEHKRDTRTLPLF
jgi:hypothetical protein